MSNTTPERVRALCCECGNIRTVAAHYSGPRDGNRAIECDPHHREGWRLTATLKCSACKAKTRHALLRDGDDSRDYAELNASKSHPAISPQGGALSAYAPGRRVVEQARSGYRITEEKGVGRGRRPQASRVLAVIDTTGKEAATAFEYPNAWRIDVEYHTHKLAGLDMFANCDGFWVRSEDEAYAWLRLFGGLACASVGSVER